jgi:hypothetical protein
VSLKSFFNKITDSLGLGSAEQQKSAEANPMFTELGMEKLKAVIAEVTSAFPLFERAGFAVEEVQVEIGLTPKLMPRFKHTHTLPQEVQQQLLAEASDKKLVKFMLISLFKSVNMQNLIQDPKLKLYGIEIDLTAVPSVRGIFRSVNSNNTSGENIVQFTSSETH